MSDSAQACSASETSADHAAAAVALHARLSHQLGATDARGNFTDLLVAMCHLADRLGLDMDDRLSAALEVAEEEQAIDGTVLMAPDAGEADNAAPLLVYEVSYTNREGFTCADHVSAAGPQQAFEAWEAGTFAGDCGFRLGEEVRIATLPPQGVPVGILRDLDTLVLDPSTGNVIPG